MLKSVFKRLFEKKGKCYKSNPGDVRKYNIYKNDIKKLYYILGDSNKKV